MGCPGAPWPSPLCSVCTSPSSPPAVGTESAAPTGECPARCTHPWGPGRQCARVGTEATSEWVAETDAHGVVGSPVSGWCGGCFRSLQLTCSHPHSSRGAPSCLLLEGSPILSAPLHFRVVTPARHPRLQALPTWGHLPPCWPCPRGPTGHPSAPAGCMVTVGHPAPHLDRPRVPLALPCRGGACTSGPQCGHVAVQGFAFRGSLSTPWQGGPQGAIPGGEALWGHTWVTLSTLGEMVSYAFCQA